MDELDEIRKRKLAELQQRASSQEDLANRQAQAEAQLNALERQLRLYLTDDGWEQWNNAKLSNKEVAYTAAQSIIMAGQRGQIQGKLNREEVKSILRAIVSKTTREIKIKGLPTHTKSKTPKNDKYEVEKQ